VAATGTCTPVTFIISPRASIGVDTGELLLFHSSVICRLSDGLRGNPFFRHSSSTRPPSPKLLLPRISAGHERETWIHISSWRHPTSYMTDYSRLEEAVIDDNISVHISNRLSVCLDRPHRRMRFCTVEIRPEVEHSHDKSILYWL